jgi:probable F420-dependent oxidoreductase
VRFGLFGLHRGSDIDPDTVGRLAALAEVAGFESLWVGDHIALPQDMGASAELPRLEALVTLSYLAASTARTRLGAGVIVLPQRQPVLLAKQLASIDVLSNGRLIVGIGVGYVERELNALGTGLTDRGARTNEYLRVMSALWRNPVASFAGRFVSFNGVVQRPTPIQKPGPPIVIGGNSPAAYARAITVGNGWYGWDLDIDETAAALVALRQAATRHQRPAELGELEITVTPSVTVDLDTAKRYADIGVHRLTLTPKRLDAEALERLIATCGDSLVGQV